MQTADDRNGSSNTTIFGTHISTATSESDNNPNGTMTQRHHHHEPPSLVQPAPGTEAANLLRRRVNTNTNNGIDCSDTTATRNGIWNLSNVERMPAVMPSSSSPKASPSKSNKLKGDLLKLSVSGGLGLHSIVASKPLPHTYKTNTSSESSPSKTALNSTSTTSSVIATPELKRNGDIFNCKEQRGDSAQDKDTKQDNKANLEPIIAARVIPEAIGNNEGKEPEINKCEKKTVAETDGAAEYSKHFRESNLLTNQKLPCENTSLTSVNKKELPSSSMPMSSPTTSLSFTALAAATDVNKASSSSTSLSSSSASTASITPVSATTPAFLSTPSSSSVTSSSTPSPSPSQSSSLCSFSPSPSSANSKIKGLSIPSLVEAELLQWHDMPQYLQFNPYVLKGYRPLSTFKGCLLSLFYWHNETINILTHAIPIVYILAIVPGLMPWENGYRFLSFCHVFGAVAPWCGSFVYHLFMNIEQGENVYNNLLKLDMVGIWVSQSFGALPLLTATTYCFTFKWKWFMIISYCLLSLWGLYKALRASSPWQRRLCFSLPFAMRSVLTFFRTIGLVGGNRVALEHVYLQDGVSILGGAIGAMRIPEKWFPGLVDFYLNSHNIMHVLVVLAVYSMYKATMKDFEWMETANCDAFVNITSKVLESTLNTKVEL